MELDMREIETALTRLTPALAATGILALAGAATAAPTPVGLELVAPGTPYSPGVLSGGVLYVSGLQGGDPQTHKLPEDFEAEARNTLDNVGRVLKDAGMSYGDVVSVQIYMVDLAQFPLVNTLYKTYFHGVLPARTTVQVSKLSLGSRIEINAIARK